MGRSRSKAPASLRAEGATELPRISPYIAKILLSKTPAHAYAAHRILGGKRKSKPSTAMKLGTATDFAVQRLLAGDVFKSHDTSPKTRMARAVLEALDQHGAGPGAGRLVQHRMEWEADGGILCSSVADLIVPSTAIFDVKTGRDLSGPAIVRQCERLAYDVQMAAYAEGWSTLNGNRKLPVILIYVESSYPYRTRWVNVSPRSLGIGSILWRQACMQWKDCLRSGQWPGWPDLELHPSQYRRSEAQTSWLEGD